MHLIEFFIDFIELLVCTFVLLSHFFVVVFFCFLFLYQCTVLATLMGKVKVVFEGRGFLPYLLVGVKTCERFHKFTKLMMTYIVYLISKGEELLKM